MDFTNYKHKAPISKIILLNNKLLRGFCMLIKKGPFTKDDLSLFLNESNVPVTNKSHISIDKATTTANSRTIRSPSLDFEIFLASVLNGSLKNETMTYTATTC